MIVICFNINQTLDVFRVLKFFTRKSALKDNMYERERESVQKLHRFIKKLNHE